MTKLFISEAMQRLTALRKTERIPITEAACAIEVSSGHLWNAERGIAKLSDEQSKRLELFYVEKIRERTQSLSRHFDELVSHA